MGGFFKRDDLERALRAGRPRPGDELVQRIEGRIRSERVASRRSFRVALPAVFTAIVVGGLAAVGGVSYAASSVVHAARSVSHVFAPASAHRVVVVESLSSGGDQYKPGYGWGDPHHNHPGPPKITPPRPPAGSGKAPKGYFTPPITPIITGDTATISTSMTLDGQAHLFISVLDETTGDKLLMTQTKSKLEQNVLSGQQAKTVNYLVLVPRTIPIKIAIPANYLQSGHTYAIQIIARAPSGQTTTVKFPFDAA
jgi:hypothetical protein